MNESRHSPPFYSPHALAFVRQIRLVLCTLIVLHACDALVADIAPETVPFERGLEKIRLELMAAQTGICVLCVAGHPDDEDGATMAWFRRIIGAEVHLCLATRGKGGQNESGPELGMALAALRTRESEASARILGAKIWYLNQPDFGYSKSAEETFADPKKHWNREQALERLVRIIRIARPDVLFTNHDPKGKDHGHHRATGELIFEAYAAAANPKRFPAQITDEGLKPWQIAKLFRRLRQKDGATVSIQVSVRDISSGHSPAEVAAWALSRHVSQGMLRVVRPGKPVARHFLLVKSEKNEPAKPSSMTSGLALSTDKDNGSRLIDAALKALAGPPEKIAREVLLALHGARTTDVKGNAAVAARMQRRISHLSVAAMEAMGLRIEALPEDLIVTPGERTNVLIRVANTGTHAVSLNTLTLAGEPGWEIDKPKEGEMPVPPDRTLERTITVTAKEDAYPSFPEVKYLLGRSVTRFPLAVSAEIGAQVGQQTVTFTVPAVQVPMHLAPAYEAYFSPDPVVVFDDPDREDQDLLLCAARLTIVNHRRKPWTLYARLSKDSRLRARMEKDTAFAFSKEEQQMSTELRFMAEVGLLSKGDLKAAATLWTKDYRFSQQPSVHFRRVPLKLPKPLRVGLVQTYDTATWNALRRLSLSHAGMSVEKLDPRALRESNLQHFDTIILGLRATQYRPDVRAQKARLHAYMQKGGNLVCLYHKDFDWNTKEQLARGRGLFRGVGGGSEISPYRIELSFLRVTDENAAVKLLKPRHPLLSRPNRIWEKDFSGWVQERGVYFPKAWDPQFAALLSSHDPGEAPLDGGLLVAKVGEGSFIYTSYVWYRQLRASVPGAYRFLANLIAYPRVKGVSK